MKPRNQTASQTPSLDGPDYFSLVIEWDGVTDEIEDEVTGRQMRHWDVVDEASDESFPASDPPAWGSSHAAATEASAVACEPMVQALPPKRRALMLGKIAVGLVAFGAVLLGARKLQHAFV